MLSARGGQTTLYTTAPATFSFQDFLPSSTAILAYVGVGASILGGCDTPNSYDVSLNAGYPGVDPFFTRIGSGYTPLTWMTSCNTPAQFVEVQRIGPSMITPDPAPYYRGGTNVITVIEQPTGTCSGYIEDVRVTLYYYDSLPSVTFDISATTPEEQRRVLMHRWRTETDYPYFSSFQDAAGATDTDRDGHISITATVRDAGGAVLPNFDMLVRVVDPPDPSTYVPTGMSVRGDNPYGTALFTMPVYGETQYSWQQVTTDVNGRISLVYPMSSRVAGDNVQIEASGIYLPYISTAPRCTPALGCYTSGIITNWRRVYIERDRMFRAGTFLTQDAAQSATTLNVEDITPFRSASANNPISAIVIHGSSPSATNPQNYMEAVNVKKASGGKLTLTTGLQHAYQFARARDYPTMLAGDAIGVYASANDVFPTYLDQAIDYYAARSCPSPPACDSLYTDFVTVSEGTVFLFPPVAANPVPFLPFAKTCALLDYCAEVAQRFFDNRSAGNTKAGHQHFIAVTTYSSDPTRQSGTAGITCKDNDQQCGSHTGTIFVFNGEIELAGQAFPNVLREAAAHELAHTFDVNQPAFATPGGTLGHCANMASDPLAGKCLMNTSRTDAEKADGRISFHNNPWTTSEYMRIRARPDPIPQTWQATFLPNP
ncbi:MAG: hypothetical protein DMF59_05370 [Acidobacteria bacterium]|nr:MAG: hypothetical protein DMF59_05370 [Acidobacteriota bacterium]